MSHQFWPANVRSPYCFVTLLFLLGATSIAMGADPITIDFEDEDFDVWEFIDEPPENLGDLGPSSWDIFESELGFDGNVLMQRSNIWGGPEDHMLMGTIAYYNAREFENFRLDVDVIADDNDGMGFVWGYQEDSELHYRFQLMNDRWPEVPTLDGFNGPYLISHKRISNSSPWYEVMEVLETDEYIPYTQGFEEVNHWTLEVVDGAFTITTTDSFGDENTITGFDDEYKSGFVGIQLYAQSNVEFDNFVITPLEAGTEGDFNGNGELDAEDMDLLTQAVIAGNDPPEFDLNEDQLVNRADREVWVQDLSNTYFGDSNLDGEFNSSDLVTVFAAGKYEVDADAGWADGDWGGDVRFDSGDLVVAFAEGGYELGPRQAANAVPEPTSLLMLVTVLVGLATRTRRSRLSDT